MRYLIWLVLPLLFACTSTQTIQVEPTSQSASIEAFGTLADANDGIDMKTAPIITALAAFRHRAASDLRKKKIAADTAQHAQLCADSVRKSVAEAVALRSASKLDFAREQLGGCNNLLR